jgi:hypothetical protein
MVIKRVGQEIKTAVDQIQEAQLTLENLSRLIEKAVRTQNSVWKISSELKWIDAGCRIIAYEPTHIRPPVDLELGLRFPEPDQLVITVKKVFIKAKFFHEWHVDSKVDGNAQKVLDLSESGTDLFSLVLADQIEVIGNFFSVNFEETRKFPGRIK